MSSFISETSTAVLIFIPNTLFLIETLLFRIDFRLENLEITL